MADRDPLNRRVAGGAQRVRLPEDRIDLVSGDAALATALNASLARAAALEPDRRAKSQSKPSKSTAGKRPRTSARKVRS